MAAEPVQSESLARDARAESRALKLDSQFPLLSRLLGILLPKKTEGLTTQDVPHATLLQLRDETAALVAVKAGEHEAALADLVEEVEDDEPDPPTKG